MTNSKHVTLRLGAESFILDAPGLDPRYRKTGLALYWVAPERARQRGYTPRVLRLHYDVTTAEGREQLAARCRALWAEALDWLGDPARQSQLVYDGTVGSLIRLYQQHPDSPYRAVRHSTRRCYDDWCAALERFAGKRRIDRLDGPTLRKWFAHFLQPSIPGGAPRIRLARAVVQQMLSILLNFGTELRLPDCLGLITVLERMEFRVPEKMRALAAELRPRKVAMSYQHALSIVNAGIARGTRRHRSVALGTAAQFEFTLSQIDVIGEWVPIEPGAQLMPGTIVRNRQMWRPGLTYEDLADGVLYVERSKNFNAAVFDIAEYPLFQLALDSVPHEERCGPLVVNDSGLPMTRFTYGDLYRELAAAAGVPPEVWNMRARHGGLTEAQEAGARLEDTSAHAQHASINTTKKFYVQSGLETTRRVARARVASRKQGAA